jgi:hypothetical protein
MPTSERGFSFNLFILSSLVAIAVAQLNAHSVWGLYHSNDEHVVLSNPADGSLLRLSDLARRDWQVADFQFGNEAVYLRMVRTGN